VLGNAEDGASYSAADALQSGRGKHRAAHAVSAVDARGGHGPEWCAAAGGLLCAHALLDPAFASEAVAGLPLAAAALAVAGARRRPRVLPIALLAAGLAAAAWIGPTFFRADTVSYDAYLRSAFFDHDLDFTNESERWGYAPGPLTPTGHRENLQSVGPALLWSPFFVVAHVYVGGLRALGVTTYTRDGFSLPYYRATALGTVTVAMLGTWLLVRTLSAGMGTARATAVVAATLLASPAAYYVFVLPGMAHGLVFGLTATVVWAHARAREAPSFRAWIVLGTLVGLVTLARWQGATLVLLLLPLAVQGLRARTIRPAWLLAAAAAAALVFTPQLVAWHVLFGRWLTIPQGPGFLAWRSPHLFDVLMSADRGLFTWTPLMAAGTLGLVPLLRSERAFALGSLLVLVATAWVNGCVRDWAASDAFGARRFDVVLPLLAVGLGAFCQRTAAWAARHPWALPAAALAGLVLWNVEMVRLFQDRVFTRAAPLERLAPAQASRWAGHLRWAAEGAAGGLFGTRGRAAVYRVLVGEFFYDNVAPSGTIEVGALDSPFLLEGWSAPRRREGWPGFRWAMSPAACARVPLEEPVPLHGFISARAPHGLDGQTMSVVVNGAVVAESPLGEDWREVPFTIPASALLPGENRLCFRFSRALPGEEGTRVAAAVSVIQLP